MIFNYNLSTRPSSFDFASFCVFAGTCGARHVHFQLDGPIEDIKYPAEMAWKRFGNIVLPITKLARFSWDLGNGEQGEVLPRVVHDMGNVNSAFTDKGRIHLLKRTMSHEFADKAYATITIRNSFRGHSRNSNIEEWKKARDMLKAEKLQVIWMDDCEDRPIDIEWRMAVYSGAVMNFGVNNGPMALCMYSTAPYIILKQGIGVMDEPENFPKGSQFLFANKRQRLVWEEDSFENIKTAWEIYG